MLEFKHEGSGATFAFPQNNGASDAANKHVPIAWVVGDVFAFDTNVNKAFQHGVPKAKASCGPRFSIIAWGRRMEANSQHVRNQPNETSELVETNGILTLRCCLIDHTTLRP